MPHKKGGTPPPMLRIRSTEAIIARLDEYARVQNLKDRSAAVRYLIMEASMTPEEHNQLPDKDELLRLLAFEARAGNVTAINILLKRESGDDGDEKPEPQESKVDELAKRRAAVAQRDS